VCRLGAGIAVDGSFAWLGLQQMTTHAPTAVTRAQAIQAALFQIYLATLRLMTNEDVPLERALNRMLRRYEWYERLLPIAIGPLQCAFCIYLEMRVFNVTTGSGNHPSYYDVQ
jgi:hypothetical protein